MVKVPAEKIAAEKIVIGVSDAASRKAVEWVIERARGHRVEVTLVGAYDWTGAPFSEVAATLRTVRSQIGDASLDAHVPRPCPSPSPPARARPARGRVRGCRRPRVRHPPDGAASARRRSARAP